MVVNSFGKHIDRKTFLAHYVGNFKTDEIEKLRAQFRAEEVENIQASDVASTFHQIKMNPRLKFIGNFYSYSGLGLFYKQGAKEEDASAEVKRAALLTA